jgi:hypothetical protein
MSHSVFMAEQKFQVKSGAKAGVEGATNGLGLSSVFEGGRVSGEASKFFCVPKNMIWTSEVSLARVTGTGTGAGGEDGSDETADLTGMSDSPADPEDFPTEPDEVRSVDFALFSLFTPGKGADNFEVSSPLPTNLPGNVTMHRPRIGL